MRHLIVCVLLCLCRPALATADLISTLKKTYHGMTLLESDIEQTKHSPLLSRPLKSQIHLHYSAGVVTWETLKPIKSTLRIVNGQMQADAAQPLPKSPQATAVWGLVQAIVGGDWARLERDCRFASLGPLALRAVPRPEQGLGFIQELDFQFHENLNLATLSIKTADERTDLVFRNFRREPGAPL